MELGTFEWTIQLRFLVALALGFLVGLERESIKIDRKLVFWRRANTSHHQFVWFRMRMVVFDWGYRYAAGGIISNCHINRNCLRRKNPCRSIWHHK